MNIIISKHHLSLFLTITTFMLTQEASYAANTINTSEIFRVNNTTLISSGGTFELGFFSPENSQNRYVGIWYKKIAAKTVVWVANRDNPLTDGSGMLKVVEPGILVLLNGTDGILWSTNTSRIVQNPVARLLDSGNLVVKDGDDDDSLENFLWQSFDYPTDTFLPGMRLGVNFTTGLEVYLRSWKNRGDPASGDYTYHCDPTGYPQLVIRKSGQMVYRTGPWNGMGFSGLPNLQKNQIFTYEVVVNKNEAYAHFELLNESVYTRLRLSESGIGERWTWVESKQEWNIYITVPADNSCDKYKLCGPYGSCNMKNSPACGCLNKFKPNDPNGLDKGDLSNGCIRRAPLNCEKGDVFLKYSGFKLPDTRRSWYDKSMTLKECKVLCSKNCSCMAYSSLNISRGENGCLLWFGDLLDMKEVSPAGQDIYIRMASSELDSAGRKREILAVTLSVVIGVFLLGLSLLLYSKKRKKQSHHLAETGGPRHSNTDNHPGRSHNKELELPQFELATIAKATDGFSINNKLGQGGFGPVYKGLMDDGQEFAVKCLSRNSRQGVDEFKNEVICIAKLQHRNLVKLLGWCIHGEEMMLVYEYMANKSLDLILFDPTKRILLDWPRRFNIINGIARGLMYLHQDSRLRVIHRDLKASNVLLDSDMNPKISDFGLARTFGGNETEVNTNHVVGTYGYMSPEYAGEGVFSAKSDVFSYGVMVLEIVSGLRNRGFSHIDHRHNLLGHAWILYREERSLELVDPCLRNSCYISEVLRSIHIGLLCVQERAEDRPSISSVVLMLSNEGILPEARYPGFFTARDVNHTENSIISNTASSQNAMTMSLLEAR